jgi:hypothetical protein
MDPTANADLEMYKVVQHGGGMAIVVLSLV